MPPPPVAAATDVHIPGLDPRHDGLRIAHLSDVHVGRFTPRAHVRAAVEVANAARPDVVVMTGDYVSWSRQEIPMAEEQLAGLRARRVLAVLGNHDYFTSGRFVTAALERNGYEVLKNRHSVVDVDGAPLSVIGIDDPITRHDDTDAAFAGVGRAGTRVVLTHYPSDAGELAGRGADLVLSGHTHGGQINVPRITYRIMDRIGLRYRRGLYDVGERGRLYVTPGVGFVGMRLRAGHGTAAEVAILTLRAAPAADAAAA
ncbi:MAG: metallophosphoesterase [Kofleriaceae bacterium]|nr:metallophosphoesterase [Myxococcales bacterium]MCB9563365.1 metallophosphoesterase [Kofleriaceae bacterium]MCB9573655.1 metallophosphoesterase [Kofleriaceae bacterium]